MRAYGKVETSIWQKPKYRGLSADAKLLWMYILACPHGNALGCFVLPDGYVMADLAWSPERVSERITELVEKRFIERDEPSSLIWILGWWGHNTIENSNVAKAAVRALQALPRCRLLNNYLSDLNAFPNAFRNEFANVFPNGWPTSIETKEPEPEIEPESEPEPEPCALARATRPPADDVQLAVDLWNETAARIWSGRQVQKLTDARRAKLKARLKDCGGIEGWTAALARMEASPVLTAGITRNGSHWPGADFDFMLRESKFTKLMEGGYDRQNGAASPSSASEAAARRVQELREREL